MAKRFIASPSVGYALAASVAGIAALLHWLILPLVDGHIPFLFLLALLFAVIFLGRGPALLVLALAVVNGCLMAPPVCSLAIQSPQDLAAALVFAVSGLLIVTYGNRLQFTTSRAALAEQRLALAQQNTGVGIFELNFEAGTAFISSSLCQMLGREVPAGEIDLALWLGGLRAEHVEESQRIMQEHIARGQ